MKKHAEDKANVAFFDDIGSPGGAGKVGVLAENHPSSPQYDRRRSGASAGLHITDTEQPVRPKPLPA